MALTVATGTDNPAYQISKDEWNALVSRMQLQAGVNVLDFGAVGDVAGDTQADLDAGTDDTAALQDAIDSLAGTAKPTLTLPAGYHFKITSTLQIDIDDLTINAYGAKISSTLATLNAVLNITGDNTTINGLYGRSTGGDLPYLVNISAEKVHLNQCWFEDGIDGNEADGQTMYVRSGSDGFRLTFCRMWGNNAPVFLECNDALIAFNEFDGHLTSGDDCIAVKAIQGVSENIRIIGNRCKNLAAFVSLGSQIGTNGADDSTYSKRVRNVTVVGNTLENVSYALYIKPGALAADYRNGVVEDIVFSDNILTDLTGSRLQSGIVIAAARGSIIRHVKGSNNIIRGRVTGDESTGHRKAMDIYGVNQGAAATIQDIDLEFTYIDPYDGAAFGTAGTSGYPVVNIVNVENDNTNGITMARINLRVRGNGCSRSGVLIDANLDGAVTVEKLHLTNYNAVNSGTNGGVRTASLIKVINENNVTLSGNGSAYVINSGGGITGSIGYGIAGTVTQATSKSTGVTLDYRSGRITMNAAALAADTSVTFTLTNARIQANDILILNHLSGGTVGAYTLTPQSASGSATITVRNVTAGSLSEAIVIGFAVVRTT